MKKLILLVLAFVMCGCEMNVSETNEEDILQFDDGLKTINPETVMIDSCEYIVCYVVGGVRGVPFKEPIYIHKGNCKFCAGRRKKEQEELIRRLKED